MTEYWKGKVCVNGHIVDYGKGSDDSYCGKCGKEVIAECSFCLAPIRGARIVKTGFYDGYTESPKLENMNLLNYCPYCGRPYKWIAQILENAVTLLSLEETIDDEIKDIIQNAIPNLLVETPLSPVAVAQYKVNIAKFSQPIKDGMYQLLVDVLASGLKEYLFPDS